MAIQYGVLKGTVSGHLRNADDDHYQILVHAGSDMHRVAVNVRSSAPNAPSVVLFLATSSLPAPFVALMAKAKTGFTDLPPKPNTLAIDYVRSGLFKTKAMKPLLPDRPGVDNDLKDKLEAAVLKAMKLAGSSVYAFGAHWGPEKQADQYFRFKPGSGVHDIHMNQGNGGGYKKDNGVFHDGGLVFAYPDGKVQAFFFAFQSQTFDTDDKGNPKSPARVTAVKPVSAAPAKADQGKKKKPKLG
jgi:uncharacterized protein YukJ